MEMEVCTEYRIEEQNKQDIEYQIVITVEHKNNHPDPSSRSSVELLTAALHVP